MEVRRNSFRAWILAARPKTLSGALIPVIVAGALAACSRVCSRRALIICAIFAALMQVAANLINDLFDYLKGTDRDDRLGPERACAQGWITPRAMKRGIAVVLALALICGTLILFFSQISNFKFQISMVALGAACVLFAFLYTTILSYAGMGDLLVLVFFGLVPCCGTYFAATGSLTGEAWLAGFCCGVLIDTLLIINNYRDRNTDRLSGKHTLIATLGEPFGRWFYLACGLAAWLLTWGFVPNHGLWAPLLTTPYLLLHTTTWRQMVRIHEGRELNRILGRTSRNMLIFGLLLAAAISLGIKI